MALIGTLAQELEMLGMITFLRVKLRVLQLQDRIMLGAPKQVLIMEEQIMKQHGEFRLALSLILLLVGVEVAGISLLKERTRVTGEEVCHYDKLCEEKCESEVLVC